MHKVGNICVEVPHEVKNPILLPKGHPFTTVIVREAHERVCHDGIRQTLTEVRRKYWIPRVRSLTRQVIYHCVICRKFEGTSFKPPPPPPLPVFRVKDDPAFTYTGVDFAGPIYVRGSDGASQKSWIYLFTCYVTRAVHLDATPNQSTDTFLRCLKRFSARRGLPSKFISDNGKTFKAASKYLKSVFKDETIKEYLHGWIGHRVVIQCRACTLVGRRIRKDGEVYQTLLYPPSLFYSICFVSHDLT